MALEFIELPAIGGRGRKSVYGVMLDELREYGHTVEWAKLAEAPFDKNSLGATASYLRRTNPDLEFATRRVGENIVLFARVGEIPGEDEAEAA